HAVGVEAAGVQRGGGRRRRGELRGSGGRGRRCGGGRRGTFAVPVFALVLAAFAEAVQDVFLGDPSARAGAGDGGWIQVVLLHEPAHRGAQVVEVRRGLSGSRRRRRGGR